MSGVGVKINKATKTMRRQNGFTIVELLIVIIVIGILTTITIVTFAGVQRRADNAALVDAAAKIKKTIQSYVAVNSGTFPYSGAGVICVTTQSGCFRGGDTTPLDTNVTLNDAIETIGTIPRSMRTTSVGRGGLTYQYDAGRTVNGSIAPVILNFYLLGVNTDCGMTVVNGEGPTLSTLTQRYTNGNVGSSGATQCTVSISGS